MEIEDRDLVGVEYPGRVLNPDKMVKTLGGLTNISKVVSKSILFWLCAKHFSDVHSFSCEKKIQSFNGKIVLYSNLKIC